MDLPNTINRPELFLRSPSAGFDGVFDWSWTEGCFGNGVSPTDLDGLIERNGNFLIFETKDVGVEVPRGQMRAYESLYALGCFTVVFIEGKQSPEFAMAWCQPGFRNGRKMDRHRPATVAGLRVMVSDWWIFASESPYDPTTVAISHLAERFGGEVMWKKSPQQ